LPANVIHEPVSVFDEHGRYIGENVSTAVEPSEVTASVSADAEVNSIRCHALIHTHTQLFNGPLSGTTQVGWYQKKHSHTDTHPVRHISFINFLHLLRSIASSLFNLHASLHVLFGLPLGLRPFTSYSMHFFTQSSSFFRNTCPYHHSLFCCNTGVMSVSFILVCLLA